jgi:hypothetical protein
MLMWGECKIEDEFKEVNLVKDIEIYHIGTKELILRKSEPGKIKDEFDSQLIPLLNEYNNIHGTQLIFSSRESNPMIYYIPNTTETYKSFDMNPVIDKQGYLLYRNKLDFKLDAILAYSQIKWNMLKDKQVDMTSEDASRIVEQSVRTVLNSVIFDPLGPVFSENSSSIKFFLQNSIGRPFESLDWFSPLSIKGIQHELDQLMIFDKPSEITSV